VASALGEDAAVIDGTADGGKLAAFTSSAARLALLQASSNEARAARDLHAWRLRFDGLRPMREDAPGDEAAASTSSLLRFRSLPLPPSAAAPRNREATPEVATSLRSASLAAALAAASRGDDAPGARLAAAAISRARDTGREMADAADRVRHRAALRGRASLDEFDVERAAAAREAADGRAIAHVLSSDLPALPSSVSASERNVYTDTQALLAGEALES